MKIERKFTENSDGTIEFTPLAEGDARIIYNYLRDHLSYLRKKINQEQNLLDITPKENEILLKGCLKNLIMFKADLEVTENKFESVKRWFDKNNLPYPGSPEDQKQKARQRKLLEDHISQKRKKVEGGKIIGKQKSKEIKKSKKKKTVKHRPRTIKRNNDIRSEYHKLTETDHLKSKRAILSIAEKYQLSPLTIRDIIYKDK